MYVSIGQLSSILGVSAVSLRRWDRCGRLGPDYRTMGRHRRYFLPRVLKMFGLSEKGAEERLNVLYARVSSGDQKEDLIRQENRLLAHASSQDLKNIHTISDLGSGLNYKKRGLRQLISLIVSSRVETIYVTHNDRLLRFGFQLVELVASFYETRIVAIEASEGDDFEKKLAKDVLEIITVFSARLYGSRSRRIK